MTSKRYDADGNTISSTDGNVNTTSYRYDADNELAAITRADGTTVSYGYDGNGNQTSQTDGAGRSTTYTFDPLDRLLSVTDPLGRTTSSGYDAAGNRTGLTDPAGRTTTYGYDAANELTSIGYSDGTTPNVTLTYTVNGQRASMTDGTGTTSYSYDALNRLTGQTNGAGQSVSYGYDLKGDLTSVNYPNGKTVNRSYDNAGRLIRITDWLGHSTTFTPDADSNTAGIAYPNGITTTRVFDAADQVTRITDVNGGGASVAGFSYTRDGNNQLTGTTPTGTGQGGNETYSYTKLNQLATLNASSYTNDASDNLTKLASGATLTYDAANELTSMTSGGQTVAFVNDSSGNRTKGGAPGGAPVDYTYDQSNRLVSTGGTGRLFAYAGSTACNAITVTQGGDDFSHGVLWSNGGVTASGASNSALAVLVAKKPPTCAFPSQFTPPGPTAVPARAAGDWPVPLPAPPATCTSGDAPKINASWLATHPPGVYCWTGTVTIAAPGATFNGYEFVSKADQGGRDLRHRVRDLRRLGCQRQRRAVRHSRRSDRQQGGNALRADSRAQGDCRLQRLREQREGGVRRGQRAPDQRRSEHVHRLRARCPANELRL